MPTNITPENAHLVHRSRVIPKRGILTAAVGRNDIPFEERLSVMDFTVEARCTIHFTANHAVQPSEACPFPPKGGCIIILPMKEIIKKGYGIVGAPYDCFIGCRSIDTKKIPGCVYLIERDQKDLAKDRLGSKADRGEITLLTSRPGLPDDLPSIFLDWARNVARIPILIAQPGKPPLKWSEEFNGVTTSVDLVFVHDSLFGFDFFEDKVSNLIPNHFYTALAFLEKLITGYIKGNPGVVTVLLSDESFSEILKNEFKTKQLSDCPISQPRDGVSTVGPSFGNFFAKGLDQQQYLQLCEMVVNAWKHGIRSNKDITSKLWPSLLPLASIIFDRHFLPAEIPSSEIMVRMQLQVARERADSDDRDEAASRSDTGGASSQLSSHLVAPAKGQGAAGLQASTLTHKNDNSNPGVPASLDTKRPIRNADDALNCGTNSDRFDFITWYKDKFDREPPQELVEFFSRALTHEAINLFKPELLNDAILPQMPDNYDSARALTDPLADVPEAFAAFHYSNSDRSHDVAGVIERFEQPPVFMPGAVSV